MPKRDTMPAWLATLDADALAELLRLRPGIVDPPPGSLVTLADRLSLPESVRRAMKHLNRTEVDVVAAAQTLDGQPSVSGVLSRVGDVDRAVIEDALTGLGRLGLAWPASGDTFALVAPLRGGGSAMLRLGSPLDALLMTLDDRAVNDLMNRLGIAEIESRTQAVDAITATLTDADRVRSIAAGVSAVAADLLEEMVWHEPVIRTTRHPWEDTDEWGPPEQRELVDAGLLLPRDATAVELPREVALALRGPGASLTLHLRPPEPTVVSVDAAGVDRTAGAAAVPTAYGVAQLVDLCSTAPLVALRTGGVGVKELRRAAKTLGTDENHVRFWLTLAYHADLLDNDDGSILPTDDAYKWLAADTAERLVTLLTTWWQLPSAPMMADENGKRGPALTLPMDAADRDLRHDLVGWFAERAPGDAVTDLTEVLDLLSWRSPYVHGDDLAGPAFVTVEEAEQLGVLAGGALSSWGRALASDTDLTVPLRDVLPAPTGSARLQADLTAMVAGIPTTELGALLDLAAEPAERDTASTWRFTPGSVRRALDSGYTADRLLAELGAVSTHELPQPLVYLVRDVGRRHGEVEVLKVACCLRSDDAPLLAEIVAHRGLAELKLRPIAPTVVGSAKPVRETLALLRKHGYSPMATSDNGTPVVERPVTRRARNGGKASYRRPPTRQPLTPEELRQLAKTLLADGVAEAPTSDPASTTRDGLSAYAEHLTGAELELLAEAINNERPVEIEYTDQNDRRTRRVITPLDHNEDILVAWCHLRDDERNFMLSRIRSVHTPLVD
jgi:hypothetical protein